MKLGRDINSLGSSLQRLESIIKNAKEQSPEKSSRYEANSTIGTTLGTLLEITGDFRQTLHDCENLLSDNSKFQRSAASFVDNVIWHHSTERVVNHLRQRVNLHLTKLNFIAKPFELHLLLGIRRGLQQAKNDVAANTRSPHQEHGDSGAQHETGVQTEQRLAFEVSEEEVIARYDEASEASFRRFLQEEHRDRPTTSSMEIADPYGHSNDGIMSMEHTSTVTPSMRSTQNPQSYGHGTEESGIPEHYSTVPSNTDGTSVTDVDDEVIGEAQIANFPAQDDITLEHIYIPQGLLIPDTAQSIHTTSHKSHVGRFPVPPSVAKHFERALASKSDLVHVQDHLPLKEGFDALVFHLASSTVKFKPSPGPGSGQNIPEETQFVNLLKSAWIMEKLKGSDYLQSAGPESLWADYTRELENQISGQLSRFDSGELEPPKLDVVLGLSNDCFSVWVPEEPMPRPAVLPEQRPLEEKILELALAGPYESRRSTLTVFRKSDVAFRLVSTTKDEQNKDFHKEESLDVSMDSTRFIPAFAASHDGEPINNKVLLCNSLGQELQWYQFQDLSAVAQFQRALTGYRVSHDMSNIFWDINSNRKAMFGMVGMARLQFWHLKPLKNLLSPVDGTNMVRSGFSVGANPQSVDGTTLVGSDSSVRVGPQSVNGTTLVGSDSSVRLGLQSPTSDTLQLSGSTIAAAMTGSRKDGLDVIRPEPPVLVIFTKCESKYTIFHIRSTFDGFSSTPSMPFTNLKQWIAVYPLDH